MNEIWDSIYIAVEDDYRWEKELSIDKWLKNTTGCLTNKSSICTWLIKGEDSYLPCLQRPLKQVFTAMLIDFSVAYYDSFCISMESVTTQLCSA